MTKKYNDNNGPQKMATIHTFARAFYHCIICVNL